MSVWKGKDVKMSKSDYKYGNGISYDTKCFLHSYEGYKTKTRSRFHYITKDFKDFDVLNEEKKNKLKLEAENQTLKCVKTEKQLLIEEFCMSDIYYRFHLKEEWRPKEEDWDELFKAIDNTYDNFTHRLMGVAPRLTMTELRVSCLIKANVPPVTIAMLIVTTPTNVSMIRKRLYDKIHSEKGSSEKFDKFIRDF